MKHSLFAFLLGLLMTPVYSQNFKVESSQPLTESIGVPCLYMKSGLSVFCNYDKKENSRTLTVFDKSRKQLYSKALKLSSISNEDIGDAYWREHFMDESQIVFTEVNEKLVLFIEHRPKKPYDLFYNQQLLRVILNPATGQVEKEELVSMEKSSVVRVFTHPAASGYCVLSNRTNYRKKELPTPSVNFRYYSNDHQLLSDFNYDFGEYVDLKNVGSYYTADNRLILFNIMARKNAEKVMVISKINLSDKTMQTDEIFEMNRAYEKNAFLDNVFTKVNLLPGQDLLNVAYYVTVRTKSDQISYDVFFQNLNLKDMGLSKPFHLGSEKLDTYVKTHCQKPEGYGGGMPVTVSADKSGNLLVTRAKNVLSLSGTYVETKDPEMVGLEKYSSTGAGLSAWAFPYHCTGSSYRSGNLFATSNQSDFAYKVIGTSPALILLNDLVKNFDKGPADKTAFARITDACEAMVLSFGEDGSIRKNYLFGTPTEKKNHYSDFHTSFYDEASKTLICLYYEGNGYKNQRVAWVQFD